MVNVDQIADKIFDNLTKKKTVSKKANLFLLPGKGRKKCSNPDCKVFVGIRTQVCDCGYEFKSEVVKSKPIVNPINIDSPTEEDRQYALAIHSHGNPRVVYVGSGSCPTKLPECNQEDVNRFCDEIAATGVSEYKVYLPSAMKNWVRQSDLKCNIREQIFVMIDNWYNQKVMPIEVED